LYSNLTLLYLFPRSQVDAAIYIVNNAIANKLDWSHIEEIVEEAKEDGHPVASAIKTLKLNVNHIVLLLKYKNPRFNCEF
jgi:hypothetical protein